MFKFQKTSSSRFYLLFYSILHFNFFVGRKVKKKASEQASLCEEGFQNKFYFIYFNSYYFMFHFFCFQTSSTLFCAHIFLLAC